MKIPFLLLGIAILQGCSSGSDLSSLSARETEDRAIDETTFNALIELVDLQSIGFTVQDGHGTLTPSAAIAGAMYPGEQPPRPGEHAEGFDVPTVDYDPGALLPTLHATLTRLDKQSLGAWLEADALHAQTILNGSVHVHTKWPWPDGDVVLDQVTIDVYVAIAGGQPRTANVVANVQDHVEHCGAFGWCNALVGGLLPNLSTMVQDQLHAKIDELLAKPEVPGALATFMARLANLSTPAGEPAWQVAAESIDLSGDRVTYKVWRDR